MTASDIGQDYQSNRRYQYRIHAAAREQSDNPIVRGTDSLDIARAKHRRRRDMMSLSVYDCPHPPPPRYVKTLTTQILHPVE